MRICRIHRKYIPRGMTIEIVDIFSLQCEICKEVRKHSLSNLEKSKKTLSNEEIDKIIQEYIKEHYRNFGF